MPPNVNANTDPDAVAREVLKWFRDAHPKLTKLQVTAVQSLATSIAAMRHTHKSSPPWLLDNPHMQQAVQALRDAGIAAAKLREAIERFNSHMRALGEPGDSFAPVLSAMDGEDDLSPSLNRKPGRPGKAWPILSTIYVDTVENILRANGFPRASVSSASGPAAAVMARLVAVEFGASVTAATVAREWAKWKTRHASTRPTTKGKLPA